MFDGFYNIHEGETGVVIGNGPSLKQVTQKFLKAYKSFGTNRIYLRKNFTPTYYVSVNPLVLDQFTDEIKSLQCTKFVRAEYAEKVGGYPLRSVQMDTFSYNPPNYIWEGFTVTYVALQLAFFMGFSKILLVGVDHRFEYEGQPNQQVMMTGDDPNHFDPDYFKGVLWNNPDLQRSDYAYQIAERAFRDAGREIINLTPNTGTDTFTKGSIKDY